MIEVNIVNTNPLVVLVDAYPTVSQQTFVETVTGNGVNNTDPLNPVLTFPVASQVNFTPYSTIAATTVQAAIQELLDEGGGGGHVIQEEGVPLAQRTNLNFVGSAVTATDDAGGDATVITITASVYTDEQAQDAVGTILVDTDDIDLAYNDVTPSITATLKKEAITAKVNVTPATGDSLIISDVSDSDNLKKILISALLALGVSDTAYAGSWDGVTSVAPSKNAVYDKIEVIAPIHSEYQFYTILSIDQDIWLLNETITQITKSAGVATASYKINGGAAVPISFTGSTWTGTIAVAANDVFTWIITYTGGYTSAALVVVHNR